MELVDPSLPRHLGGDGLLHQFEQFEHPSPEAFVVGVELLDQGEQLGHAVAIDGVGIRAGLGITIGALRSGRPGRGWVDVDRAKAAYARYLGGDRATSFFIWQWINLELWARTFFDEKAYA